MSDAPERIWTTGNETSGSWNADKVNPRLAPHQTEYIRADLAAPKVKPLVWRLTTMGYEADSVVGKYEIYPSLMTEHWLWRGENGIALDQHDGKEQDQEAAESAVQADVERRILEALK